VLECVVLKDDKIFIRKNAICGSLVAQNLASSFQMQGALDCCACRREIYNLN
jgi:hypothetical protein